MDGINMKVIIPLLLCVALALSSVGCSSTPSTSLVSNTASSSSAPVSSSAPTSSSVSSQAEIKVDNGVLSDTITFPSSLFEGQSIDAIKADAAKSGVTDVTKNKDGSVTYKMSKATHQKMIDDTKQTTVGAFNKMKNSTDSSYIKDITYNNNFTEVTLIIDKSTYDDSLSDVLTFNVGMQTYFYQVINGVKSESIKTTIKFQDQKTKKVFETAVYPD